MADFGIGEGAAAASSASAASAASAAAASTAATTTAAASTAAASAAAAEAATATAGTLATTSGLSTLFGIAPAASSAGSTIGTLQAVSAGLSAAGQLISGIEGAKASSTQSEIAKQGAAVANQNAKSAFDVGIQKEEAVRRNAAQQLGAQAAGASESGFISSSGSMLTSQVQSAGEAELDALQTRYQGILQGQAYQDQASNDQFQSKVAKSNVGNALLGGVLGAGTAALTSYSRFARLGASVNQYTQGAL
jgi:hypothetical protein